jgi:hypothetical protein
MIISQMFNIEAMSAYAIKKMAPRIVIAVILIQLSWFIFTSLIAITNLIGDGAKDLLMAPFGGGNNINNITSILHQYYINHPVAGVTWQVGTTGVVTVFGLGMLLMTGLGAYIGMLLGGFAIALIIAIAGVLFLLITRVVIVIALLVISPLALIAWILPNTQNMWQQWWKLFSRMLILYPMIVVLFTIGKIVAWLAANMK